MRRVSSTMGSEVNNMGGDCWKCGGTLVWLEDVDVYEQLGYEGDGVCSRYSCIDCGASVTYEPPMKDWL